MAFFMSMLALTYLVTSYYYTMYRRDHPSRNDHLLSLLDEVFLIDVAQDNHVFYYQMLEWMTYGIALGIFMGSIFFSPQKENRSNFQKPSRQLVKLVQGSPV